MQRPAHGRALFFAAPVIPSRRSCWRGNPHPPRGGVRAPCPTACAAMLRRGRRPRRPVVGADDSVRPFCPHPLPCFVGDGVLDVPSARQRRAVIARSAATRQSVSLFGRTDSHAGDVGHGTTERGCGGAREPHSTDGYGEPPVQGAILYRALRSYSCWQKLDKPVIILLKMTMERMYDHVLYQKN